jgi:prefoldin subunit 5
MAFKELSEEITLLGANLETLYQTINQVQQEVSITLASVGEFLNQFNIVQS